MNAETLAAQYVAVMDQVVRLAQAVTEGRWSEASNIAFVGVSAEAERMGEAANSAEENEVSPAMARAYVLQRILEFQHVSRPLLEFLDPQLTSIDPWGPYRQAGVPEAEVLTLPPVV